MQIGDKVMFQPQGASGPEHEAIITKVYGPDMVDLHIPETDQEAFHVNYWADRNNMPMNARHAYMPEGQ